jgi:hypothetical protein
VGRRNRFVKPKTITIEISEGDKIQIKKELTVGERKSMYAKSMEQIQQDGDNEPKITMNVAEAAFAKVNTYLVGWSFEEEDGNGDVIPVELTEDAVRSLDEDTFAEIEAAIDKHVENLEKEKKVASAKTKRKPKS